LNILEKQSRIALFDRIHRESDGVPIFARLIDSETVRLLKFLINENSSVLDLGCGDGHILAALNPSRGVGVDCSETAILKAKKNYPGFEFIKADVEAEIPVEGTFDYVLLSDVIGDFLDVWDVFHNLKKFCGPDTRIIVTYYNKLWDPAVTLATWLLLRHPTVDKNWFSLYDMQTFLGLNGFQTVTTGSRIFCPLHIPFVAAFLNRVIAKFPFFRLFNFLTYAVARIIPQKGEKKSQSKSVTVVVPTRNEKGNIQGVVERTPELGAHTEILFVDGDSTDGTVEEILKYQELFKGQKDIKLIHQVPPNSEPQTKKMLKLGKGDAVRKGFKQASGEILMILDADITVSPVELSKFYMTIAEGHAEFINGNRLSYPLEKDSMQFLNLTANHLFGILFTWILGQRIKDTLCGTKVLTKNAYERIAANRAYFGDFDPFGDFDLLFGAAKQNLKITDLPVRYYARTYGDIKVERFKHGVLLLKMCWFAFKRFKLQ